MLAALIGLLLPSSVGAQDIDALRARASDIAAELDRLHEREAKLTQDYLTTSAELDDARGRIEDASRRADEAQQRMEVARGEASAYALNAFIRAGSDSAAVAPSSPNEAMNQQVLLDVLRGDRQAVADAMRAAKSDLGAEIDSVRSAERELEAKKDELSRLKAELDAGVERQEELLAGVNSELQAAIEAEQARREAEAAARVRAQAEAQAAQLAAAQAQRSSPRPTTTAPTAPAAGARAPVAGPLRPSPVASAPPVAISGPNPAASRAIAAAMSQLGVPYRWGGSSPATGFDCSGLVQWAYGQAGVRISRTTYTLWADTQRISIDQLQPGDLVFFSSLGHMGMYIGGGQMVHAPRTGKTVEVVSVFRGGFSYMGAGRLR